MDGNDKWRKSDIAMIVCLYVIIIIIFVLLVFSIINQKKVVKDSQENYNEIGEHNA